MPAAQHDFNNHHVRAKHPEPISADAIQEKPSKRDNPTSFHLCNSLYSLALSSLTPLSKQSFGFSGLGAKYAFMSRFNETK